MKTSDGRHAGIIGGLRRSTKILVTLVTLVAGVVAGTGVAALFIRAQINSDINTVEIAFPDPIHHPNGPGSGGDSGDGGAMRPLNFLVLGSDSRSSGGDPKDWQLGGQRSDVMLLAQISGDRQSVNVMSIPRDSWVPIEGYGDAKINAAFSHGGPELAISTVQNLTGVAIDHFAIVDFTSFEELTDELGGVTIETAQGAREMNGEQALDFVRERYALPQGDFDRVRRQQAWIKAIMAEVFEKDVLTSPNKVASLINIVLEYSAMDQGINFDYMAGLALEARNLRPGSVQFMTAPYTGTGRSPDGKQSIVVLDYERLDPLMEAWAADAVAEYIANNPDAVVSLEDRPIS